MPVRLDADLGAPFTPDRREATLEVSINADETKQSTPRRICLLVDTSTSMDRPVDGVDSQRKIEQARAGVIEVLEELSNDDRVSIVGFDTHTDVVVEMQRWGNLDRASVFRTISGDGDSQSELRANGATDVANGLETALAQFPHDDHGTHVDETILLSDGCDRTPIETYESLGAKFGSRGIPILAAGIGSGYDEQVMLTLAKESGGEPFDIGGEGAINTFLRTRVEEAAKVVSSRPELEIDLGDGFVLEPDAEAVFTEPQILSRPISTESGTPTVVLPRLKQETRQEFSLQVLGSPKQTGVEVTLTDLTVKEGDRRLATASVTTQYEVHEASKRPIASKRRAAEVVLDMSKETATEVDIEKAIAEIDDEATRADLKQRLGRTDTTGGKIEVTKEPIDTH